MTNAHEMRQAIDIVTACLKDCLNEPDNKDHQQALICAVKHFNTLGYGFQLTREYVRCFPIQRQQAQLAHNHTPQASGVQA